MKRRPPYEAPIFNVGVPMPPIKPYNKSNVETMKKVYVISCGMGFVSKVVKQVGIFSGIRFTDNLQKAKRFYSEKEAQEFIDKYDPNPKRVYYHIKDVTPKS